ncbi:hypothetical protein [Sporosarcina sp. FA9]|uniref:hypothetical protein n=1 Tax=Sporosarcina sp. FA9 TaxID=3413030 RepID=UPI003F65EA6F
MNENTAETVKIENARQPISRLEDNLFHSLHELSDYCFNRIVHALSRSSNEDVRSFLRDIRSFWSDVPSFDEDLPSFIGCPLFSSGCPLFLVGCPLFSSGCPLFR